MCPVSHNTVTIQSTSLLTPGPSVPASSSGTSSGLSGDSSCPAVTSWAFKCCGFPWLDFKWNQVQAQLLDSALTPPKSMPSLALWMEYHTVVHLIFSSHGALLFGPKPEQNHWSIYISELNGTCSLSLDVLQLKGIPRAGNRPPPPGVRAPAESWTPWRAGWKQFFKG